MSIPQKAIDLILTFEGLDQPSKWPGGASGITLGHGYDLGYEKDFVRDWDGHLPSGQIERLKVALGVTGVKAKALAPRFRDIVIHLQPAMEVFTARTLPKYEAETFRAFPGAEKLPPLVFGALVSLVFNRGGGMDGPRRSEMRRIREAVKANDLAEIAQMLRSMKRLWKGKGLDGLLRRREAEARLVEEAISDFAPPERSQSNTSSFAQQMESERAAGAAMRQSIDPAVRASGEWK